MPALSGTIGVRGLLTACEQEFDSLGDDAVIYKLVGPVLVKQDTIEAKQNVEKRLEFIKGELCAIAPFFFIFVS